MLTTWTDGLAGLRWKLHEQLLSLRTVATREGSIAERVRLFEAAVKNVLPWKRASAQRTLGEARSHVETARQLVLAEQGALTRTALDLGAACFDALDALQRIANNEPDAMEVAAQALDRAQARLERYATPGEPTIDVALGADTNGAAQGLRTAQETMATLDTWVHDVKARARKMSAPGSVPAHGILSVDDPADDA